jgi:hypothetical protein
MKTLSPLVLACAMACALPAPSTLAAAAGTTVDAPHGRMKVGEIEIRARVIELDPMGRQATLKGPRGRIVTIDVPPEVKNFDQVRVGDDVTVRYAVAVAARIEPASNHGIRERVESSAAASAAAGGMPGVSGTRKVEVLATIEALDPKARTATLRGATREIKLTVPPDVDIGRLKVGQEVRAVFVEAAMLGIERVPGRK